MHEHRVCVRQPLAAFILGQSAVVADKMTLLPQITITAISEVDTFRDDGLGDNKVATSPV